MAKSVRSQHDSTSLVRMHQRRISPVVIIPLARASCSWEFTAFRYELNWFTRKINARWFFRIKWKIRNSQNSFLMNFRMLFLNRDSVYDYARWSYVLKYLFINCIKKGSNKYSHKRKIFVSWIQIWYLSPIQGTSNIQVFRYKNSNSLTLWLSTSFSRYYQYQS